MFLTPQNLPFYLIAKKIISSSELIEGDLMVFDTQSRNRSFRALRQNKPSLFIKQVSAVFPETVQSLYREAKLYDIANSSGALRRLRSNMVSAFHYDGTAHCLILEHASEAESLTQCHTRLGRFPRELAALQAHALAASHANSEAATHLLRAARCYPHALPLVLQIPHNSGIMTDGSTGQNQAIAYFRELPAFMESLAALGSVWTTTSLIHGDIKWDNILLSQLNDGTQSLKLVDWELADVGDPSWDVACVLAAYIQYKVFSVTDAHLRAINSKEILSQANLREVWEPINVFWSNYISASDITEAAANAILLKATGFAGARFALTALELLNSSRELTPIARTFADLSHFVMLNPVLSFNVMFGLGQVNLVAKGPRTYLASLDAEASETTSNQPTEAGFSYRPPLAPFPHPDEDIPSSNLRHGLLLMMRSVKVHSVTRFQLADMPPVELPPGDQDRVPDLEPSYSLGPLQELIRQLWQALYINFYTTGSPEHVSRKEQPLIMDPLAADQVLLSELRTANATKARWDPGWEIYQVVPNGNISVKKGDKHRLARPGEFFAHAQAGVPLSAGLQVTLQVHPDSDQVQQGMYYAFGDMLSCDFDDGLLARIYLNLDPSGTPAALQLLSSGLNALGVPYRFKCPSHPGRFMQRSDAGVLYIARKHAHLVLEVLSEEYNRLATHLRQSTPLFAKRLAPGIAAADNPPGGPSFGQSRMHAVAAAIVECWTHGTHREEDLLQAVAHKFRAAGTSLAFPHLNSGCCDPYSLLLDPAHPLGATQ